jgi:DNA integrity scanning protein DisA with diadenylate cyclase activity
VNESVESVAEMRVAVVVRLIKDMSVAWRVAFWRVPRVAIPALDMVTLVSVRDGTVSALIREKIEVLLEGCQASKTQLMIDVRLEVVTFRWMSEKEVKELNVIAAPFRLFAVTFERENEKLCDCVPSRNGVLLGSLAIIPYGQNA